MTLTRHSSAKSKPYLKNYNALVDTVPVVVLKSDNVMYTQALNVSGVEDVWSVFGPVPPGVDLNSGKAVHLFPYKGDFCMSVGAAVWRKRHRDTRDPEIKLAAGNWPKLYVDAWEKVGDACLPQANARGVLPFVRLVGKDIRFHLVVLADDGRLLALDGDLAAQGNQFIELKNVSDPTSAVLVGFEIQRAAYWNGSIVAYDNCSYTWNLDVDFDAHTFVAKDFLPVDRVFVLTATDTGPVGVKEDGWLYRGLRSGGTIDGMDEKKTTWARWIQLSGVTNLNLGVASAGVMLDLETLTRSLRDDYLGMQTSIYAAINKIQAFATTHEVYLRQLLDSAENYQDSDYDHAKHLMAIRDGKRLVAHAKIWARILHKQIGYAMASISAMANRLLIVKGQLNQQLVLLQDKLRSLEEQIKALNETKAKADAMFWDSIRVILPGFGLAAIGASIGVGAVTLESVGGPLFVGGLVTACHQSSEEAVEISNSESEVQRVVQAIVETKAVADGFWDHIKMFETLNKFWGSVLHAGESLEDMDEDTAAKLGASILGESISIQAALDTTRKVKNGSQMYLSVLNRVGIMLSEDSDEEGQDWE